MFEKLIKSGSKLYDSVIKSAGKHQPEILAGLGIGGYIVTIILAVKATPKASEKIRQAEFDKNAEIIKYYSVDDSVTPYYCKEIESKDYKELTLVEKTKLIWKDYLPAVCTGTASTLCIIGSVSESCRRNAVLATALNLAEESARDYRQKVIETIGEKKEQKIREDMAQDELKKHPVQSTQVFLTNSGNTLCYDSYSGRYFRFDIDKLKKANNEINERLLLESQVSLNELYLEYGLDGIDMGFEVGWSSENGLIDFDLTSKLTTDDEPCLVISYNPMPQPGYAYFYK